MKAATRPSPENSARAAIRLSSTTPRPTTTLATPCRPRESRDEAIAEFRAAIRLKPDDATAHYNLGNALKAQGKL